MKRSLLAYNGFGTVFAILLWYGFIWIGLDDPAVLFVGAVAGLLFSAALAEEAAPWFWLPLVLIVLAIVCLGAAHLIKEVDALYMFLVVGTLFLTVPISSRVLGTYELHFEQELPGTPAFLAFAWFVNLGIWWGIGAALIMYAAQLGLAYWLKLKGFSAQPV